MESPSGSLCQRCGRPIRADVPRCMVCGWSADEELRALDDAGRVRRETLRCAATLWPFVLWAALFGLLAVIAGFAATGRDGTNTRDLLICAAFVAAGPGILVLRLLRNRRRWVQVDPHDGLVISGQRRIAWEEIVGIEHEPGLLAHHESWASFVTNLPLGSRVWKVTGLLIPLVAVYFVILPVLVELTPWGAREVLVLESGERIVLRDLDHGMRFAQSVRYKLESAELAAAA